MLNRIHRTHMHTHVYKTRQANKQKHHHHHQKREKRKKEKYNKIGVQKHTVSRNTEMYFSFIITSDLQTRSGSNKCYISREQLEKNNIWMFLNLQETADETIQATSSSALFGLGLGNRSTGII